MATFQMQEDQDAYQIAENTPRERHSQSCGSIGTGALVTKLQPGQLCGCWVIDEARSGLTKKCTQ